MPKSRVTWFRGMNKNFASFDSLCYGNFKLPNLSYLIISRWCPKWHPNKTVVVSDIDL